MARVDHEQAAEGCRAWAAWWESMAKLTHPDTALHRDYALRAGAYHATALYHEQDADLQRRKGDQTP